MWAQTVSVWFLNSPTCKADEMCVCLRRLYHFVGPEGVAKGEDALSILENSQSRSQFIDELMEVEYGHLVSNYSHLLIV